MLKTCPLCGSTFECRHHDIAQCQCTTITLTPQAKSFIKNNYNSCLCIACLKKINSELRDQY